MLTLKQLFELAPNLKQYVSFKLSSEQKSIPSLPLIPTMAASIAINPHIAVIQVHVG
jgi:hypothetical protein